MKLYTSIIFSFLFIGCSDKESIKMDGIILFKDKKYEESITKFNQYLELNDTSETALLLRAKANHFICENEKSIDDFHKLINLNSNNWLYFYNTAMLYYLNNKLDSASVYFEKSYQLGSKSFFGRYLLLNTYYYGHQIKRDSITVKHKIDSLTKHYFSNNDYFDQYLHYEDDFFNDNIFNLTGCSENDYTYLNWLPKRYTYTKGENIEGYLFLMGFLKNQVSDPEFYLLSNEKEILQKINVDRGICHFSFRTDTLNFQEDSVKKDFNIGAKIRYKNSSGIEKDSMFYLQGTVVVKKKNIS